MTFGCDFLYYRGFSPLHFVMSLCQLVYSWSNRRMAVVMELSFMPRYYLEQRNLGEKLKLINGMDPFSFDSTGTINSLSRVEASDLVLC